MNCPLFQHKKIYKHLNIRFIIILPIFFLFLACEKEVTTYNESTTNSYSWIIDTNYLSRTEITFGFPVITIPVYEQVHSLDQYQYDSKVIVFKIDTTVYVFPIAKMGVEVVNDNVNDVFFAVTYCPITRSSYVINRKIDSQIYTYAASGILYKNNLVYYDIKNESLWSQMQMININPTWLFHTKKQ